MNKTAWIVISALCVLGLATLVILTKKDAVNVGTTDAATIVEAKGETIGDQVYGKKDAKVIVFEYADFQCPGCRAAHTNTKKIQEIYKDDVAFVFRNFPLTSIHPNALAAATVAEAAGLQGKYWEMNDLLFINQSIWESQDASRRGPTFESYAKQIGLDIVRYNADLPSTKIAEKIKTDQALAKKLNVDGTPTFYIGDKKIDASVANNVIQGDGTKMMDLIDQALRDAGETPPNR